MACYSRTWAEAHLACLCAALKLTLLFLHPQAHSPDYSSVQLSTAKQNSVDGSRDQDCKLPPAPSTARAPIFNLNSGLPTHLKRRSDDTAPAGHSSPNKSGRSSLTGTPTRSQTAASGIPQSQRKAATSALNFSDVTPALVRITRCTPQQGTARSLSSSKYTAILMFAVYPLCCCMQLQATTNTDFTLFTTQDERTESQAPTAGDTGLGPYMTKELIKEAIDKLTKLGLKPNFPEPGSKVAIETAEVRVLCVCACVYNLAGLWHTIWQAKPRCLYHAYAWL